MTTIIMPREKWDPLYRKAKELKKKKEAKQSKVKVKCLKEREGKYLFQRADGLQYWISHEDVGSFLDGEPCTDEDF